MGGSCAGHAAGSSAPGTVAPAAGAAAGAARLELLARMEQQQDNMRRRPTNAAGPGASGSSASGGEYRLSPSLTRPNGVGSGSVIGAGGCGAASATVHSLDAQRVLAAAAVHSSEGLGSSSPTRRGSVSGTSASRTTAPGAPARSVAEQRLTCSAGPPDSRAPGASSAGAARRSPHTANMAAHNWHSAEGQDTMGVDVTGADGNDGSDGWRVNGCWGFYPGTTASGARARQTASPQVDSWSWHSRRQGALNQLNGPMDRRRGTPPTGGFSLMPSALDRGDASVPVAGAKAASAVPTKVTSAKHESQSVHALQGARLHSLPMRTRLQGRGL